MNEEDKLINRYKRYQCNRSDCRFRCPALPEEVLGINCPNCQQGKLILADQTFAPMINPHILPPREGQICLLLDNIRSIYNVGAMFRTAEGAGINHLFCCGMTAKPDHPKVAKTALGAQALVPWTYMTNAWETAVSLQAQGWRIWALERTDTALDLFADPLDITQPIVLVVGNERGGVDKAITHLADRVVALPMVREKESLNVAVAAGIALYTLKFGKNQ